MVWASRVAVGGFVVQMRTTWGRPQGACQGWPRGLWRTMGMSSLPLRAEREFCAITFRSNESLIQWETLGLRWNLSSHLWAGGIHSGNDYAIWIRNATLFIIHLSILLNIYYVIGYSAGDEERDDLYLHVLYSLAHKNINKGVGMYIQTMVNVMNAKNRVLWEKAETMDFGLGGQGRLLWGGDSWVEIWRMGRSWLLDRWGHELPRWGHCTY